MQIVFIAEKNMEDKENVRTVDFSPPLLLNLDIFDFTCHCNFVENSV